MPRLGIFNMLVGFFFIFLAAAGGPFLALDMTESFLKDSSIRTSWLFTLLTSAHGHTNLFGFLHIVFGLSIGYSNLTLKIKKAQTFGLGAGSIAMSLLMFIRAYSGPVISFDALGFMIGCCLSAALAAIGLHVFGLAMKLNRSKY